METDQNKQKRQDFADHQAELTGMPNGKQQGRFLDADNTPRGRQKLEEKRRLERAYQSALEQMLLDPVYRMAFDDANDAIDRAQSALDLALQQNAFHIADLEDRAVKLPDGRPVFLRADGRGETADGEIIPLAIMVTLDIPADAPTIDAYDAARNRRSKLGGYADQIDDARRSVNDDDSPMDQDDLKSVPDAMDDIIRQIEARPSIRNSFNPVSASEDVKAPLDLSGVPELAR